MEGEVRRKEGGEGGKGKGREEGKGRGHPTVFSKSRCLRNEDKLVQLQTQY